MKGLSSVQTDARGGKAFRMWSQCLSRFRKATVTHTVLGGPSSKSMTNYLEEKADKDARLRD